MHQSAYFRKSFGQLVKQCFHCNATPCAGAAAVPLAAYATRRAWTAVSQTLFPPVLDAGRLSDLCHMTQLEWLEVKSSTMPTPEEWSAALRPLTCLRRLDVRNTSFRDPLALQVSTSGPFCFLVCLWSSICQPFSVLRSDASEVDCTITRMCWLNASGA